MSSHKAFRDTILTEMKLPIEFAPVENRRVLRFSFKDNQLFPVGVRSAADDCRVCRSYSDQ